MAMISATIDPSGGGDYTSLAAWGTFLETAPYNPDGYEAVCMAGNVGPVVLRPSHEVPIRIRADQSARHDGKKGCRECAYILGYQTWNDGYNAFAAGIRVAADDWTYGDESYHGPGTLEVDGLVISPDWDEHRTLSPAPYDCLYLYGIVAVHKDLRSLTVKRCVFEFPPHDAGVGRHRESGLYAGLDDVDGNCHNLQVKVANCIAYMSGDEFNPEWFNYEIGFGVGCLQINDTGSAYQAQFWRCTALDCPYDPSGALANRLSRAFLGYDSRIGGPAIVSSLDVIGCAALCPTPVTGSNNSTAIIDGPDGVEVFDCAVSDDYIKAAFGNSGNNRLSVPEWEAVQLPGSAVGAHAMPVPGVDGDWLIDMFLDAAAYRAATPSYYSELDADAVYRPNEWGAGEDIGALEYRGVDDPGGGGDSYCGSGGGPSSPSEDECVYVQWW